MTPHYHLRNAVGSVLGCTHVNKMTNVFKFIHEPKMPQITCCSLSCLATSLAELPETSIQVLLKKAQEPSMNVMYRIAWIGSVRTLARVSEEV